MGAPGEGIHHQNHVIERYTIKFGPAVSQKELEKALHEESKGIPAIPDLHKMKARIELIGDFEDLKKIRDFIKELGGQAG
jgi:hypothetical protein